MTRYHINEETGKAGICKPEQTGICGLKQSGEEEPQHYGSLREAEEAHAVNTVGVKHGKTTSLSRKKGQIKISPKIVETYQEQLGGAIDFSIEEDGQGQVLVLSGLNESQVRVPSVQGATQAKMDKALSAALENVEREKIVDDIMNSGTDLSRDEVRDKVSDDMEAFYDAAHELRMVSTRRASYAVRNKPPTSRFADDELLDIDKIDQIVADYKLDAGNRNETQEVDGFNVYLETPNGAETFLIVDEDATVGDLKREMIDALRSDTLEREEYGERGSYSGVLSC